MGTLLSPDKEELFKKMWLAGVKENEIARILKIRPNMVPIYARVLGLPPRSKTPPSNRKLTDEDLELMKIMWYNGATVKEIAEYFGVSTTTILDYLHAMGLRRRIAKRCPDISKEILEELCIRGLTDEEIARLYDTSKYCITRLRQKYGINKRALIKKRAREKIVKMIDVIIGIIEKKGYVTSRELKERGIRVTRQLLEALENFVEDIRWFKLVYTSTANFSVFPTKFNNMIIIYIKGYENKVISFLLKNVVNSNVPINVLRILLKENKAPPELIKNISYSS